MKVETKNGEYRINLSKYIEAGFDTLWKTGGGGLGDLWIVGFFCQGPESLCGDGLICYLPLQGQSVEIRNKHLSPVCKTIQEAVDGSYKLWKENKDEEKEDQK